MQTFRRYKLDIPAEVSGRPVTNRGVHLQPFGYHGVWMDREVQDHYWTGLLKSMGISWVTLLTEGDSVLERRHGTTPLEVLLDAGIIPIIRDKAAFPSGFTNAHTVERTVAVCERYGLRPFWQLYNEPFDAREWRDGKVPPYEEAWQIIARRWSTGARDVINAGAYAGFPDGPGYRDNPFERIRAAGGLDPFRQHAAFYAMHSYGLGRPLWYPYDAVTRHGAALTEEAYGRILDDFDSDPQWRDVPSSTISEQRRRWVDAGRTAIQDDTCWRGWEKVAWWALQSLGEVPAMAMTEGGWTPRARAGVGPVDNRWSYTTPKMVAKKTLRMFDAASPFFAICPWLLASNDMGGSGWYDDAWYGGSFSERYGREKPVIPVLRACVPRELAPVARPAVTDLDDDTRDWPWVQRTLGAGYRRGEKQKAVPGQPKAPIFRLVEVLEYEGPATLDVTVVDADGLPVEGALFYHHFPGAPEIPAPAAGGPVDEWYDHAVLKATDEQGRISFAAGTPPGPPGSGREAIWPQGKGDVLENLGFLAGTPNRHLNGIWQLVSTVEPGDGGDGGQDDGDAGPQTDGDGDGGGGEPQTGWQVTVEHRPGARILAGSLPEGNIPLSVSDPWGNTVQAVSGSKPEYGPGGFEVLAPHVATYTVRFLDQSFPVQTHEGVTLVTFRKDDGEGGDGGDDDDGNGDGDGGGDEPQTGWQVTVERRPGARILAGSLPEGNIPLSVSDPWGNTFQVVSGSKPEYGPGGFEVLAPHVATYTVRFLDQSFPVQTQDGATLVTFRKDDGEGGDGGDDDDGSGDGGGHQAPEPPRGQKLGFYVHRTTTPGLLEAVHDCQPPTMLIHADDWTFLRELRRWMSPDTFVVGRLHLEPWQQEEWLNSADPAARGRAFAETILSLDGGQAVGRGANGRLLVDAWMSLNECIPGPASEGYKNGPEEDRAGIRRRADAYDRFQVAFRQRLQQADPSFEAVAFNFAAGNFDDAQAYLEWFPRTLEDYVYLGFHEYGWPALSQELDPQAATSAGTYRQAMEGIRQRYGDRHRVIISEAGMTRLYKYHGPEDRDVGWLYRREPVAQEEYWRSLEWYNTFLAQDDYVLGCCLFEVGHASDWETFRHLGLDNDGHPIQIVPWIRALRERVLAAGTSGRPAGGGASLTRPASALRGRVVSAGQPLGMVRLRLSGTAPDPSPGESGGPFGPARTHLLPENPPGLRGEVVWDRQVSGIRANRRRCWVEQVREQVPGLDWPAFAREVVEHNPGLAADGYRFRPFKTYLLPRSAGRELDERTALTSEGGWFEFPALPAGDYMLEVVAQELEPHSRPLSVSGDTTLTLDLEPGDTSSGP